MAPGIEWEPLTPGDWILVERYFSLLYQWINMNYFVILSIVFLLFCTRMSFRVKIKKTNRNCLIITVSLYIVNVLLVDFCVKNYSHILLYLYSPILFFIFDESWENRYYSFFFFFYRYLGNWETIVNYDKSLFISTGQKDK